MDHRSTGVYKSLEWPRAYEGFQRLLGGRAMRRRFVEEFVQPAPGMRLLDVGCGIASLLDYLPRDVDYVGFDVNPSYIEAARRHHGARGRFFHASVFDADAHVADSDFDGVVAKSILHHLSDGDAARLAATARRALRPGGWFVAIDPTRHADQSWIARALIGADRGARVRSGPEYRRLVQPYFTDIADWLVTDMLRIPYSFYIMKARRP